MINLIPLLNGYSLRRLGKFFLVILFVGAIVKEGIAKLPASEKSMILSQFAGVAERPELRCQGHTRESRTWRRSGKMAQKGDFAGAESFAIPSKGSPVFAEEGGAPLKSSLRVKYLKNLDRFLNWSFGDKYKTYVLGISTQERKIDIAVPELKAFADSYGYFSVEHPMVGAVTRGDRAFAIISALLKTLYDKRGDSEYSEIAVAEVLTKVLAYHDLRLQQTVMIPVQTGEEISLEKFEVDQIFDLGRGMPAFGLISEHNSLLLFRGTDFSFNSQRSWASFMSDLDLSGPGFSAFQRSKNRIAEWLKGVHAQGKPARVMGFSLGGALAAYTFIYENQWLAEDGSVSIGSPGLKKKPFAEWTQLPEKRKRGFVSLISRGEIIPKVGKLFGTVYVLSTPETYKPITAHTMLMSAQPFFFKSKIDIELENRSR